MNTTETGTWPDSHMIEDGKDDTEQHLTHSKNHRHFHLVGVGEHKFVLSHLPDLRRYRQSHLPLPPRHTTGLLWQVQSYKHLVGQQVKSVFRHCFVWHRMLDMFVAVTKISASGKIYQHTHRLKQRVSAGAKLVRVIHHLYHSYHVPPPRWCYPSHTLTGSNPKG